MNVESFKIFLSKMNSLSKNNFRTCLALKNQFEIILKSSIFFQGIFCRLSHKNHDVHVRVILEKKKDTLDSRNENVLMNTLAISIVTLSILFLLAFIYVLDGNEHTSSSKYL